MKISVIIPVFNRHEMLKIALESVLAQTHFPHEIIIVDDGSMDDVKSAVQDHLWTLSRETVHGNYKQDDIIFLRQENKGVSAARNLGLKKSSGDWIALLDSDDYWLPEKLDAQVKFHKKNPDLLISQTNEIWIKNGVRINPNKHNVKIGGDIFEQSLERCMVSPSAVIFHKSLINEYGNFDEELPACEDYDLWLRFCIENKVGLVEENLVVKTGGHNDQLSNKYEAMDKFRLQSLLKLIASNSLNEDQLHKATEILIKKAKILKNGAVKRGNLKLADYFEEITNQYPLKCRHSSKVLNEIQ